MARLLKTDGSEEQVSPKNGKYFVAEEIHGFVGGYFEIIITLRSDRLMFGNEDAKRLRLPLNRKATEIAAWLRPGDYVSGDVLIVSKDEVD